MTPIRENVPLAPLTTFGIGGPARFFVNAKSENDVFGALEFSNINNVPLFVMGSGSNLLVSDSGFPGVVLKVDLKGVSFESAADQMFISAEAGEDWDQLVAQAVSRGLAGVECLSGIPGSVGGTPVQNVGAYGQEISEVLASVRVLDRHDGKIRELANADCGFSYRTSIFNTAEKNRYIVLGVTYVLRAGGVPTTRYADLRRRFEAAARPPSLTDVRIAVREIRASKAMLISAGDLDCRSAGSFFKNPIVSDEVYLRLQSSSSEPVPRYPVRAGYVKVAAAWLIERSGIAKGFTMGPAAVSSKHTLALVNTGGAQAEDILRLGREIRRRVEERFGLTLVPEPVFLGFTHQF